MYKIVEVTCMKTRAKSFKIYRHPMKITPPVVVGLGSREEAEARIRELVAQDIEKEKAMRMRWQRG